MKNDKKVAVIMSTYNGEKYIREQIDSILAQTYKNIDIYVRDDGSTDKTVEILKEYEKDGNIKLFLGENLGFIKSFFKCLSLCNDASYFAYCDQDDVWIENKIQMAVDDLSSVDSNIPILWFSNSDYYDMDMNFLAHADSNKKYNFRNSLVECVSQGMTMIINSKTRNIILENLPQNSLYHDWWTYMICSGFGNIIYNKEPLVKYRRHGNSVTAEGKNNLELLTWRIKKFFVGDSLRQIKKQLIEYQNLYANNLKDEDKKLLKLFTNEKYSLINAIKKTFYPKRFRRKIIDEIMLRCIFLIGKL